MKSRMSCSPAAVRARRRFAEPRKVDGDGADTGLRQPAEVLVPHAPIGHSGMEQHHRFTRPGLGVGQHRPTLNQTAVADFDISGEVVNVFVRLGPLARRPWGESRASFLETKGRPTWGDVTRR